MWQKKKMKLNVVLLVANTAQVENSKRVFWEQSEG